MQWAGMRLGNSWRRSACLPPWCRYPASQVVAPSAIPYNAASPLPRALRQAGIDGVVAALAEAARRAARLGLDLSEVHAAHGYLLHQFLSPISNQRTDAWGGSFENRTRLVREVVKTVRAEWPDKLPLLIRLSATDWVGGGWGAGASAGVFALILTNARSYRSSLIGARPAFVL